MNTIVRDNGFNVDDWEGEFANLDQMAANMETSAIDLASDVAPEDLAGHLSAVDMIRVDFPSFADGRGFTIAHQLRLMGYTGRLRAKGHIIADQYAMARRAGFDEVEIDDDLARRQPQDQWLLRADWQAHNYQSRLAGSV